MLLKKIFQGYCDRCGKEPYDLCEHIETNELEALCRHCSNERHNDAALHEKTKYLDIGLLRYIVRQSSIGGFDHERLAEMRGAAGKLNEITSIICGDTQRRDGSARSRRNSGHTACLRLLLSLILEV